MENAYCGLEQIQGVRIYGNLTYAGACDEPEFSGTESFGCARISWKADMDHCPFRASLFAIDP